MTITKKPVFWWLLAAGLIAVLTVLFIFIPTENEGRERQLRDCRDLSALAEEQLPLRNVELIIPVISVKGIEELRFACQGVAENAGRRVEVTVYILPHPDQPDRDTIAFFVH